MQSWWGARLVVRIAKSDYFAGVFITTILKPETKSAPILCDAPEGTKQVLFETGKGSFNVFVQYSMSNSTGWDRTQVPKRRRLYWNVSFSENQYLYLRDSFCKENRINLVEIVCTDKNLSKTKIAILTINEAIICLEQTTEGGARSIAVSRTGSEHTFVCYGAGRLKENFDFSIRPFVNHLRYFDNITKETIA